MADIEREPASAEARPPGDRDAAGHPHDTPTPTGTATRIILYRQPGHEVELRIDADAGGVVLTRREMRRDDPLDLPHAVQLQVPTAAIDDVIRALAKLAGRRDR
jgi:hypothetical protein